jgi:cytochrome c biogenesis protein CcdA
MEEKYGKKVQIEKYDISDMSNYELLMKFEDRYGVKEDSPMVLFVGDKYFAGSKAIERHLDEAIEDILSSGVGMMAESVPTWRAVQNIEANTSQKHLGTVGSEESVANVRPKLIERFRTFSLMAVLGAGLVDGINPCAFVTIVFFISVLTYKGRKKKELLIVGSFFSLSVFLVYLMLGVGVFKVFQKLEIYRTLSRFLYCGIIAGVFILGIYSLYDCFIYMKTKKAKDIKLQLPRRIKHRIHAVISKNFRTRGLVTAAVITGTSVSILESVCTGQVYLPTIVFLTREPSLRMQAYSYLVLYNLMFIVPLVIVFLLAYAGVGWERFAKFSEKHVSLSKLLLAGMFFGLGTALLVTG